MSARWRIDLDVELARLADVRVALTQRAAAQRDPLSTLLAAQRGADERLDAACAALLQLARVGPVSRALESARPTWRAEEHGETVAIEVASRVNRDARDDTTAALQAALRESDALRTRHQQSTRALADCATSEQQLHARVDACAQATAGCEADLAALQRMLGELRG